MTTLMRRKDLAENGVAIPSQVLLILLRVMLRAPRFSAGTPSPPRATLFNRRLQMALPPYPPDGCMAGTILVSGKISLQNA